MHKRLLLASTAIALSGPAAVRASERSELLVSQGQAAYQAGRVADARDRFAAAVADDPDDYAAQYALGLALAKLGRFDEAEAPLEKARALRPDFTPAGHALGLVAYRLGEAALRRGEYDRAAARFDRAAALAPAYGARSRYLAGVARARAGRRDAARADLEAASRASDRQVAAAAAASLDRLGGAPPAKRWEIRGLAGFQYDSNPALASHDVHQHRDEAAFLLGAHGRYDVLQRAGTLVRLDYDLYQSLLPAFQDFDFRAHQLSGTASHALRPWLWAGVQGGYNHYSLGSHGYLAEPFVLPFLSFAEGTRGSTQLLYRHGEGDYLSKPFDRIRDGQTNLAAVNQLVFFGGGGRYVTFGYQFDRDDPRRAAGDDYERESHQAHLGVGFPAWWKTAVELLYLYRNDAYTHRNSFAAFREKRDDDEHRFHAGVKRRLAEHLDMALAYRGAVNRSNIGLFDYRRSVVSLVFEVTY